MAHVFLPTARRSFALGSALSLGGVAWLAVVGIASEALAAPPLQTQYVMACSDIPDAAELFKRSESGTYSTQVGYVVDVQTSPSVEGAFVAVVRQVSFYRDAGNFKEILSTKRVLSYHQLEGEVTAASATFNSRSTTLRLQVDKPARPTSKGRMTSFRPLGGLNDEVDVICHPCPNLTNHDREPIDSYWFRRHIPITLSPGGQALDPWEACGRGRM